MRGGLGDTNVNNVLNESPSLNKSHMTSTMTTPQRIKDIDERKKVETAKKMTYGLIRSVSGTHNNFPKKEETSTIKKMLKGGSTSTTTPTLGAQRSRQRTEGRSSVKVTMSDDTVFNIDLENPTVGELRKFISENGDNFFRNIRRRELFQAKTGFLYQSNLKNIKIPFQCIRISPNKNRDLDILEDNYSLDEFDLDVFVTRKPYLFSEGDNLLTLQDLDDCRVFLYQCVGEQELNDLTPESNLTPGMPNKTSLLHKLIKKRRNLACLAVLEEDCRFRQVNHCPNMESSLMAAARMGMSDICHAIMARTDFNTINVCEHHHRINESFVPKKDVHSLRSTEGMVVLDGGYTALEIALMNKLEDVAIAICAREDFREMNNVSPGNWTCLMHAIHNDLPHACVAILNRPDFRLVNQVNMQRIERNAWQMCKKKATPPITLSTMRDLQKKYKIRSHCQIFAAVQQRIEGHSSFVLDSRSAFTVQ